MRLYEEEVLPPLKIRYGDFAEWEQEHAEGTRAQEAERFWRKKFTSREQALELPVDAVPSMPPGSGASYRATLSRSAVQVVRELARELHMNEAAIMAAAFGFLLGRWSGTARFLIGMPIAQRELPGTERMVGLLLNTPPLQVDLTDGGYRIPAGGREPILTRDGTHGSRTKPAPAKSMRPAPLRSPTHEQACTSPGNTVLAFTGGPR